MNPKEACRLLEALVFASVGPLTTKAAREVTGLDAETVTHLMHSLRDDYLARRSGLVIEEVAGGWRLATAPDLAEAVTRLGRTPRQAPLSPAALETLAVVAYQQPATRAEVEAIRGVHSDSALRTLEERGLIREVGRREGLGRPVEYGTTEAFLTAFSLRSLSDLPPLPEIPASEEEEERSTSLSQDSAASKEGE